MTEALGTTSRKICSRFDASALVSKLTPVQLPPGRFKLATKPSLTGSPPEDNRNYGSSCFRCESGRAAAGRDQDGETSAGKFGGHRGQPIISAVGPAIFDGDIFAFDITDFPQSPTERGQEAIHTACEAPLRKPITGMAGCCALAASGHAAAAPPSRAMNSRRLITRSPRRHDPGA